jgi:hypothetical protein
MAARNKPAGIRSLVYGMDKGKAGIEGLSVSLRSQVRGGKGFGLKIPTYVLISSVAQD